MMSYDEGLRMREESIRESANYQPTHAITEQLDFLRQNLQQMDWREHAQRERRAVYCLFTVPGQHVYGNCLEELLDNAIERRGGDVRSRRESGVADSSAPLC